MRVIVRAPRGRAIASAAIYCYSQEMAYTRYPTWRYRSSGQRHTWTHLLPYWWDAARCDVGLDAASSRGGWLTLKLQRRV